MKGKFGSQNRIPVHQRVLIYCSFGFALILLECLALAFRMEVRDRIHLLSYEPSGDVLRLGEGAGLSDEGMRLLFIGRPVVVGREMFNARCRRQGEWTIVLGCYVSGDGIYIYGINDPRLEGIESVTAAHEMLHVAFERLGFAQRDRITSLLNEAYKELNNSRIEQVIAKYREVDPNQVGDELHSILGTEVAILPTELEEYYSQYFDNRQQVVTYAQNYAAAFSERTKGIEQLDSYLQELKGELEEKTDEIRVRGSNLTRMRNTMNQLLERNRIDGYNRLVADYNREVEEYNNLVAEAKEYVNEHNLLVGDRNAMALEVREMVRELDSR